MHETPSQLIEELQTRSALYDNLSERLEVILDIKPTRWLLLREESKSIAEADRKWEQTEEGQREGKISREMERHEKRISVIKAILRHKEIESRNQY